MRSDTASYYCEMWALLGGLPTTPEQDMACLFLEAKGLRFCVDYGYKNAVLRASQFMEWGCRYYEM